MCQDAKPQIPNQIDWVLRYIAHAVGLSVLILPFGMGQLGILPYCILLLFGTYSTGHSLIYLSEIVSDQSSDLIPQKGINYTNYFTIIKHYLPILDWPARILFIFDVLVCTAFYFRLLGMIILLMLFPLDEPTKTSPGISMGCYAIATLILLAARVRGNFGGAETSKDHPPRTEVSFHMKFDESKIENLNVNQIGELPVSARQKSNHLNMEAVVDETYSFDWRRFAMLMLLGFMMFIQFVTHRQIQSDEDVILGIYNATTQCPGILQPSINIQSIFMSSPKVIYVFSSIMFALMNYAMILPICLEELTMERPEYTKLVFKAKSSLFVIYTIFPLMVNRTLGDSTPVIFFKAYGQTIYGILFCVFALLMTLNGMQLRVMVCVKLIEVLFGDANIKSRHWITIIALFFTSFILAQTLDEMQLIIILGPMTCSILLIIIPSLVYIKYTIMKIKRLRISFLFVLHICQELLTTLLAALVVTVHIVLLIFALWTLGENDIDVGNCRQFFNNYWGTLSH
ncbi:uncharacterized protein LOC120326827 isoform X2 [Styela clava]